MRTHSRRLRTLTTLAAAVALTPLLVQAQAWTRPGDETFELHLGGATGRFNTEATINGNTHRGNEINLEDNGGLNKNFSSFVLDGTWRVARNHRIDGLYFENDRSGSKATERSYTIGDTTIPAGTVLSTDSKTSLGYLGYRYSLVKNPGYEIGLGIGAYGANVKFKFDASQPVVNIDKSTTLPLPVLVLSGDFYVSERVILGADLAGLKVKIGDVDGSVYQIKLKGEYLFTNNFGIGAAVERFDAKADVTKSGFNGSVNLTTNTGQIYLTLRY
jgi:hypothetical protein